MIPVPSVQFRSFLFIRCMCNASQLPPDRLVLSITSMVVQLALLDSRALTREKSVVKVCWHYHDLDDDIKASHDNGTLELTMAIIVWQ